MNDVAIIRMLTEMAARQTRIEAMLVQLTGAKTDTAAGDLLQLIASLSGGSWFAARELWAMVEDLRRAAEATGEPVPEIAAAFDDLGLSSVKSLGKWLATQDPVVVKRTDRTRDGVLWQVVTLAG